MTRGHRENKVPMVPTSRRILCATNGCLPAGARGAVHAVSLPLLGLLRAKVLREGFCGCYVVYDSISKLSGIGGSKRRNLCYRSRCRDEPRMKMKMEKIDRSPRATSSVPGRLQRHARFAQNISTIS
jgi:hypothetical protein